MCGFEDRLVRVDGANAVAPLDLVGVRAHLAREHPGVGVQPDDLVAQPAVVQLAEEAFRAGDEHARVDRRLCVDGGLELGRAVVRIDEPFDMSAELQPEPDIALGGGFGHLVSLRSRRAHREERSLPARCACSRRRSARAHARSRMRRVA